MLIHAVVVNGRIETVRENELQQLLTRCRAAWPTVALSEQTYLSHLASRQAAGVATAHVTDLYLACACSTQDPEAMRLLRDRFLSHLAKDLACLNPTPTLVDDVRQLLLQKLFVPSAKRPPRIGEYAGQGPLKKWVRAVALRTALDLMDSERAKRNADDAAIADAGGILSDPELEFLRDRYRGPFRLAMSSALKGVSSRDRNVLRMHYLSGRTLEQIAKSYGVHRATVARWIAAARTGVIVRSRKVLREELQLSKEELQSLMRLMKSHWEVSLGPLLSHLPEPSGID